MRLKLFSSLCAIALTLQAAPAADADTTAPTDTLDEAIVSAMTTNPSLAAARQRLAATRESLPQARAEMLPSLTLSASTSASASETRFDDGTTTGSEVAPWSGGVSASQLLFASGRVAATTRQA